MAISPREQRIDYAQGYIARNPNTSKRGLQAHLKQVYGVGLRDATIRGLLQKANTPNVLRTRLNTPAFFAQERKELKQFLRKGNPPYLTEAINQRYTAYKDTGLAYKEQGYSFKQFIDAFRKSVKSQAKQLNWLTTSLTKEGRKKGRRLGQVDIFKVLKYYRRKAIENGDYEPVKKRRVKVSKERIDSQRAVQSDKQQRRAVEAKREKERATLQVAIDRLDSKIPQSQGEQRARLIRELQDKQRRLGELY